MKLINSKISRKKLYERIYEPCKTIKTQKVCEDSKGTFYDEAAKLLTLMYLTKRGAC